MSGSEAETVSVFDGREDIRDLVGFEYEKMNHARVCERNNRGLLKAAWAEIRDSE